MGLLAAIAGFGGDVVRVLFTSTQGVGHYQPLRPFIESCLRDHDVMVLVPPALEDMVRADGYPFRLGADPPSDELDEVWRRVQSGSREQAERLVLREIFGRLKTQGMLPSVREMVAEWQPDVIIHESAEFAGALVGDQMRVPHARVGVSRASTDMLELASPVLEEWSPGVTDRIWRSPYLTLFPGSLDSSVFPATHRFSSSQPAIRKPLPNYWPGVEGPLVYATFGSVTGAMSIAAAAYRAVLDAVHGLAARVLLTTGHAVDSARLRKVPPNVHVAAWIPQAEILPHAAAVVCHGGSGTTIGALTAGVPLIVAPLFADQPDNARGVADTGAGVAVMFEGSPVPATRTLDGSDTPRIRAAIETVLHDRAYRTAATHIAEEIKALPPVDEACRLIQSIAARRYDPD